MKYAVNLKFAVKDICLFLSLFIITISGSRWARTAECVDLLEYAGFSVLMSSVVLDFLRDRTARRKKHEIGFFVLVSVIISLGFLTADLSLLRKFILLMTTLAVTVSSLLSEDYLNSIDRIKLASKAVFCGVLASFFMSLISGAGVTETSVESVLGFTFSFNGGIVFKNYFAADMIIVFVGYYLYYRSVKKSLSGMWMMLFVAVMILLSNSRGAYVMFLVFLFFANVAGLQHIKKNQRVAFALFVILLGALCFAILYKEIALNSGTYMYRVTGWRNYIRQGGSNLRRLFLGISELLYDKENDYVWQFKVLFGFDGSMEFALLNILVKNGLLGLIGYVAIFVKIIRTAMRGTSRECKVSCIAIAGMLLVSALVETYIQSVHSPVGIYCYLAMAGLAGMCSKGLPHEKSRA